MENLQGSSITDLEFTEDDIKDETVELLSTSPGGPDKYPENPTQKLLPLYLIGRKSMNQGTIPHLLKSANIIPIHKWGSKSLLEQYRPVALTSH